MNLDVRTGYDLHRNTDPNQEPRKTGSANVYMKLYFFKAERRQCMDINVEALKGEYEKREKESE